MSILGTVLGVGSAIAGTIGAASTSAPTYDYSGYDKALSLITSQEKALEDYYTEAGKSLESQYGTYYGQQMQDAVNKLAASGVYSSPISQVALNRTTTNLAQTYATAKSNLAAQKLSSESSLASQKAAYYTSLADTQYQTSLAEYQDTISKWGVLGGVAGSIGSIL